jgi:hypothetical protein
MAPEQTLPNAATHCSLDATVHWLLALRKRVKRHFIHVFCVVEEVKEPAYDFRYQ